MIKACNLLARIFVIILTEVLSREMGLKSPTDLGLSTFRIKVMNEELMLLRLTVLLKKS